MTGKSDERPTYRREDLDDNWVGFVRTPPSSRAVIFVHGWNGQTTKTWTWKPGLFSEGTAKLLPELLCSGPDLDADYFCFGHSAGPLSEAGIEVVAVSLRTYIRDRLGEKEIALVAHSLGGLACRRMILDAFRTQDGLENRIVGLLMLGTPNLGTEMVKAVQSGSRLLGVFSGLKGAWAASVLAQLLSRAFGRGAANDLKVFSSFLLRLNQEWLDYCARNTKGGGQLLLCEAVGGERDLIVPYASAIAATPFGASYSLNKGHVALAKAKSFEDGTCLRTFRFIENAWKNAADLEFNEAVVTMVDRCAEKAANAKSAWLREEIECVELLDTSSGTTAESSTSVTHFNCRLRNERRGLIIPRIIRIGAVLSGDVELPEKAYYRFGMARGLLTEKDHASAAHFLSGGVGRFEVAKLEAEVEGQAIPFFKVKEDSAADFSLLTFEAGADFDPRSRNTKLRLEIHGLVAVDQGWYCFYTSNLITDRLHIELTSPTKVAALGRNWSCSAEVSETWGRDGKFKSALTYKGPVFREQFCYWVIGRERADGK